MFRRYERTDQEWEQIASLLPPEKQENLVVPQKITVPCLTGWFGLARRGAPWRDLPERYGVWNSVYSRIYSRKIFICKTVSFGSSIWGRCLVYGIKTDSMDVL